MATATMSVEKVISACTESLKLFRKPDFSATYDEIKKTEDILYLAENSLYNQMSISDQEWKLISVATIIKKDKRERKTKKH